ncbi:hypothetical protein [Streptomyces sp. NPDC001070]
MAIQLFDADEAFVDRMIALADLPWSRRAVEDAFVRNGWHHVGAGGEPVIGWLDAWPIGEHWLELGEHPGCGDDTDAGGRDPRGVGRGRRRRRVRGRVGPDGAAAERPARRT